MNSKNSAKRTLYLNIPVSPEEKEKARAVANSKGVSVAGMVRSGFLEEYARLFGGNTDK